MKIVYFNPTGVLGGAEMNLLDVLATVRSAGVTIPQSAARSTATSHLSTR